MCRGSLWPIQAGEDEHYVIVTVSNNGEYKVTLTHLVGFHYKSTLLWLRRKPTTSMVVKKEEPKFGMGIPYVLAPGEQWSGGITQNTDLEKLAQAGRLYFGVHHSGSRRPVLARVVIDKH